VITNTLSGPGSGTYITEGTGRLGCGRWRREGLGGPADLLRDDEAFSPGVPCKLRTRLEVAAARGGRGQVSAATEDGTGQSPVRELEYRVTSFADAR